MKKIDKKVRDEVLNQLDRVNVLKSQDSVIEVEGENVRVKTYFCGPNVLRVDIIGLSEP